MSIFDRYKTFVFDFDGVIINSNPMKTDAFRQTLEGYPTDAVAKLVDHHVQTGGVSRFKKFEYFFSNILNRPPKEGEIEGLLTRFSHVASEGLLSCALSPGLEDLMAGSLKDKPCIIISGSKQDELRNLVQKRDIARYFDHIFGSPDSKDVIFAREIEKGTIQLPALYIGDAFYDHRVSTRFGLDFIFAKDWTEAHDWQSYFADKNITIINRLSDLTSLP